MNFKLSRTRQTSLKVCALSLSLGISIVAFAQVKGAAANQVDEIFSAKSKFTSGQRKMSSDLAFGLSMSRGQLSPKLMGAMNASPELATAISTGSSSALIRTEISGTPSKSLQAFIGALGGHVIASSTQFHSMTVDLPITALERVANHPSVKGIFSEPEKSTNGVTSPGLNQSFRFATTLEAMVNPMVTSKVGSLTSQGYIGHGANLAFAAGYRGAGVKVGVLSDSASSARVAALIASGDLPADTVVLSGQAGPASGHDEGTAMMEIVHDLAPDAKLYFATAFNGVTSFANNIVALKDAGCNVIIDDVSYFNEGVFQDGPIAQAVNQVTAAGVLYFSSAANDGNLTSHTSGTWEGDFSSGGAITGPIATAGETGLVHSFGPRNYETLQTASSSAVLTLSWSDPLGASNNDYDLFLVDATGTTLKAFSAGVQNGSQDPYESIGHSTAAGDRIYVVKFSGADRAIHLGTHRQVIDIQTASATSGHNAGANTVSCGATYWGSAHQGVKIFNGTNNPEETFSSDGPRRIFYNPDGSAITPGNFLLGSNGGLFLHKPDVTAADGVSCKTPGFLPFFGTSAAAPHAGAVAAIVWSAVPTATRAQIKDALINSALDNMAPGWDRDGGYGVVMAMPAINYAKNHANP